jgi:hypothetical protein
MKANRPTIMGTRHMCASRHYLAATAAFEILEASCWYFQRHHNGALPKAILRTVVPSAIDEWITAIRFARDGFVMYGQSR